MYRKTINRGLYNLKAILNPKLKQAGYYSNEIIK